MSNSEHKWYVDCTELGQWQARRICDSLEDAKQVVLQTEAEHAACVGFHPAVMREAVELLHECDFDRFVRSSHVEGCPQHVRVILTGKFPDCTCGCTEFWRQLVTVMDRLRQPTVAASPAIARMKTLDEWADRHWEMLTTDLCSVDVDQTKFEQLIRSVVKRFVAEVRAETGVAAKGGGSA